MIGIYDYDFTLRGKGRGLPPPSIEAMKMATYLKRYEKKPYRLLTSLEQILNCEKVYFFTNQIVEEIPTEVFFYDNIEFYGEYMSEVLSPLIQHMAPDVSLYKEEIQKRIAEDKVSSAKALSFLDSIYYQAKINGETLPVPPMSSKKKIYIYDKDFLGYEDCWEILDKIIEKRPSTIHMTEMIQCHTMKQFLFLREEYEKVSRANKIALDYFVPLHQLEVYFGKYKMKLLGEITKNSSVYIYLGKCYGAQAYNNTFYVKNILYCLNLLFSYYSRNIPIMAEIYYPKFEEDNPYIEIYKAIKSWANNEDWDIILQDSFRTKLQKEKLKQLLDKHPIMKPFFSYSKNKLKDTRGIWRII